MKKWIFIVAAIALIGGAWWGVKTFYRFEPPWAAPKYATISRGDIRVPIASSGLVNANRSIEVKSEASGVIEEVRVVEGTFVHMGDVLAVLKKDDEQRAVDRAKAEVDRAEALLGQAEVGVNKAQIAVDSAAARRDELNAQLRSADFEWQKCQADAEACKRDGSRMPAYSPQEHVDIEVRYRIAEAQKRSAEAALQAAWQGVEESLDVVALQTAALSVAAKALEDARQRLVETTILAPQDGIVTDVFVQVGSVVQSGKSGFGGGTPLLKLADVSVLKVVARVDEADFGHVAAIAPVGNLPAMPGLREHAATDEEGMKKRTGKVRLSVDTFPNDLFEGAISRVEPQGRLNAGASIIQFDVHVEITDPRAYLLPLGVQAQVEFTVESASDTLRVPAEAVKEYNGAKGVWVKTPLPPGVRQGYGKKFIPCRLGITDGEFTQLVGVPEGYDPLKPGDEVYTKLPREVDDDE